MSKPTTKHIPKTRTVAQVKAEAKLLAGDQSRVALAATGDALNDSPTPDTGTVGELWLYGVVGGWWRGFDAESVANALRGMDVDTLVVRIHSPGGYAPDGIAIANLLRNHKAHVVVVVDGLAASAASVIAIAGDEIVMCPGSQMMLHDASTGGWGNAAELRRAAEWIDGQSDNYAGVYAYKAGGTPAEWRIVMLANDGYGTWYTAEGAVAAGLADSVGTRVAVGSPPTAPEDELDDGEVLARAAHDLQLLEQCVHPAARAAWQGENPKPPTASADGSITTQETESAVAQFSDEQMKTMRQELGLPEDADEATIVAALSEALAEQAEEPTSPTTKAKLQVPEGMSLIETDVLETLRKGAQDGAAARTQQLDEHRDRTISQAIADGKITPARKDAWQAKWAADPEGAEQELNALEKGLVPVEERGHDQTANAGSAYDALYGNTQKGA